MSKSIAIVWFREDLRLKDNPALSEALFAHDIVIPVFIWASEELIPQIGAASRYWLHRSLQALSAMVKDKGSALILRLAKSSLSELTSLAKETGATAVYWNRLYQPHAIDRDKHIKENLEDGGIECHDFQGNLLLEPWHSTKDDGTPYKVFTPFARSGKKKILTESVYPKLQELPPLLGKIESIALSALELEPKIDWANGIGDAWQPGEDGAQDTLRHFIKTGLRQYSETRNIPSNHSGVSRLSPYLHFGEISIRQVWTEINDAMADLSASENESANTFLNELLWREFSHHLLHYFPQMPSAPLREEFKNYPWQYNKSHMESWQTGNTGFPIVDAGMRQLWQTGWMHNRVRMIVASFLIKDLGIKWQTGGDWFWDTLVDADLAQNSMNWQWSAGCGADAAPFFRVFNPTLQSKKFDPEGDYIREFVPELRDLPAKYIHEPANAPEEILAKANIKLDNNYPRPIVDHKQARKTALHNYSCLKSG